MPLYFTGLLHRRDEILACTRAAGSAQFAKEICGALVDLERGLESHFLSFSLAGERISDPTE